MFEFLVDLNRELDDVPTRVLSRHPLSSVCEIFLKVRHEAHRCKIMLAPLASSPLWRSLSHDEMVEKSTLKARVNGSRNSNRLIGLVGNLISQMGWLKINELECIMGWATLINLILELGLIQIMGLMEISLG